MTTTDSAEHSAVPPHLVLDGLVVRYGAGNAAVNQVSLRVTAGEVVVLLGANGAGKTSTLLAAAGALTAAGGQVSLFGSPTTEPLHRRSRRGVGLLPEERCVFTELTVRENLRLGRGTVEGATRHFPELVEHLDRRAGLLSGGQQQMLALGRVLAGSPRVLLADELSLGLAPVVVKRLLTSIRAAANAGVAVLLVEQHVNLALEVADRAYVVRRGKVVFEGDAAELREQPDRVAAMYLEGIA